MNRRSFLRSAAATGSILTLSLATASASPQLQENPALLDIGARLDKAEAALVSATDYYNDALAIGDRLWPRAPAELLQSFPGLDADLERDITGEGFSRRNRDEAPSYVRSLDGYRATAATAAASRGPGSKARKILTAHQLQLAEQYAAEKESVLRASGFRDAECQLDEAVAEVERLGHEAHIAEARTMAGVAVKAKAIRAWGRVPKWKQIVAQNGREAWAPGLAASLLSVLDTDIDERA